MTDKKILWQPVCLLPARGKKNMASDEVARNETSADNRKSVSYVRTTADNCERT